MNEMNESSLTNGSLNNTLKSGKKQPKGLMSKFTNLMKDTKSSAIRNSKVGRVVSNY